MVVYTLCITDTEIACNASFEVFDSKAAAFESMRKAFIEVAKNVFGKDFGFTKPDFTIGFEARSSCPALGVTEFYEFNPREGYACIGNDQLTVTFEVAAKRVHHKPAKAQLFKF
jgi:hypothetical protein